MVSTEILLMIIKTDNPFSETKKQHRNFQEYLYEKLQDPKEALAYLNAALQDEDDRIFLLALRDVLEARGAHISNRARD